MRRCTGWVLCLVICLGLLNGCSSSTEEPRKVDREIFDKRKMPKAPPKLPNQ